jgi:uncharacterized membrane protein YbaN (DUF454 family)
MNENIKKYLFLSLGFVTTALGVVGLFVPLMPTTCFLIVAVWSFSRSNPALSQKILQHPQFGPTIENWMENKSISGKAKCKISMSIVIGFSISFLVMAPSLTLSAFLVSGMITLLLYINTRSENNIRDNKTELSEKLSDQEVIS